MDAPCSAWTTVAAVRATVPAVADTTAYPDLMLGRWLSFAEALLYRATGRIYSGSCTALVRPVGACTGVWGRTSGGYPWWYDSRTGRYGWGDLVGSSYRGEGVSEVRLGYRPVTNITNVVVDGASLDPSVYRLDDDAWLVRIDGGAWPIVQDLALPDTEPGTWSVALVHGVVPPADGRTATEILAGELALANNADAACRLPKRVTTITRQGVTAALLDPMTDLAHSGFGLPEVDWWVRSVNPAGLPRPSRVLGPNVRRQVRRTGTGS